VSRPEIVIDRSEIRPRGSQRKITITSPTQPSPELIQDRLAQLIHKQKNMLLEIAERNKKNNHEIRKIDNQNHKITGIFTEVIKKNITPQKKGVQLFVEPEEVEQPKPVSPVR
jgi:DNA-binding protein H-NS